MRKKKSTSAFKIMLRVLADMKQIRWLLAVMALLSVASVAISLVTPSVLGSLTDALYALWADGTPIKESEFFNNVYFLGGIYLLAAVLGVISMLISCNATSRYFTYGLRVRISSKISRLPVKFADNTPTGEVLSRMIGDVSNMSTPIYDIAYTLIDGFVKLVGISL